MAHYPDIEKNELKIVLILNLEITVFSLGNYFTTSLSILQTFLARISVNKGCVGYMKLHCYIYFGRNVAFTVSGNILVID